MRTLIAFESRFGNTEVYLPGSAARRAMRILRARQPQMTTRIVA
jgi:predicted nucleotidyltransferase